MCSRCDFERRIARIEDEHVLFSGRRKPERVKA